MPAKIPATVVTGFLGAGKTTLIRHMLQNAEGKKIALIINEFGDLGVDGDILKGCGDEVCTEDDIVELSNGCIELFEDQIACADMIVVNKADLLSDHETDTLTRKLKTESRDGVQVVKAAMGALPIDVLLGQGIGAEADLDARHEVHHHHHHHADDDHHLRQTLQAVGPRVDTYFDQPFGDALCADHIHFYTARENGVILGTGAVALMQDYAEVKSMFTAEAARGKGAAAAILRQIEDTARDAKAPILKLETGNVLHAAHRLYARQGFTPSPKASLVLSISRGDAQRGGWPPIRQNRPPHAPASGHPRRNLRRVRAG